jgi:sec-independent protein translocase protein TatA
VIADIFGMDFVWVLLVAIVLFGGSQLPKLAKNAGEAMREFRKVQDEATNTAQSFTSASPASPAPPDLAPPVMALTPAPVLPSSPERPAATEGPAAAGTGAGQAGLSQDELDALLAAKQSAAQIGPQAQA